MHDMMKRHEVQVLRRAGVTQEKVAELTRISVRAAGRIEVEEPVVVPNDEAARERRGIGRPSEAEPVRGLVAMVLLFNAMQTSLSMVHDRETGTMRTLLVSPFPRSFLLVSKLLGGVAVALLQAYAFLVVCAVFRVDIPWSGWLYALPALLAAGMMLGAVGLLI